MEQNIVKGIVMKVTERQIILMCSDGSFKNIPRSSETEVPLLGEWYQYVPKKRIHWFKYSSVASVFLFILLGSLLMIFDKEPAYVVAIDINPSIEIFTDKDLNVLRVEANNNDAEKLLASKELTGEPIFSVVDKIVDYSIEAGFLNDDSENFIATTIVSLNGKNEIANKQLDVKIEEVLKRNTVGSDYLVSEAKKSMYDEAKKEQVSVNHFAKLKTLEEDGYIDDIEEYKGKTLAELKRLENKNKDVPNVTNRENVNPKDNHGIKNNPQGNEKTGKNVKDNPTKAKDKKPERTKENPSRKQAEQKDEVNDQGQDKNREQESPDRAERKNKPEPEKDDDARDQENNQKQSDDFPNTNNRENGRIEEQRPTEKQRNKNTPKDKDTEKQRGQDNEN